MNPQIRKELDRLLEVLDQAKSDLEVLATDQQVDADDMPENLHGGERHERAETAAEAIDMVADELADVIKTLADLRSGNET